MRKLFYTFLFVCIAQTSFGQFDGYEKATSNKELIDFLQSDKDKFEYFINLFSKEKEPKEPRPTKALKLAFNQAKFDKNVAEKSNYNFKLSNEIDEGKIEFRLYKDPNIYRSLDELNAKIYPTKINYHDGTTEIVTEKINLSSNFSNDINLKKAVKQMDVELVFSTPNKLDSIILPIKNNNKITKNGINFEIIKQDNQSVTFITNSTNTDFAEVQAITQDNKRIDSRGYTKSAIAPEKFNDAINQLMKNVDNVLEISKKDSLMNFEEFKTKFFSNLETLQNEMDTLFNKDSNNTYITYTFGAPVKQIILYDNNSVYERKITSTITAKNTPSFFSDNNDESISFYDLNANLITKIKGDFYKESDYFYAGDNQYYYFDLIKKQMIPLSYYKIETISNNYILANEDDESPYFLIDKNNQKLMQVDKFEQDSDFDLTLLKASNKFYIINNQSSQPIEIKNIDDLSYAEKGYFIAKKNDKYGFIDANGKNIIPIEYDEVQEFNDFVDLTHQDLLFGVKKNGKWGFVDAQNKTIIPFIYNDVKGPFSYGLAPVYDANDKLGLINTKNEKVTKFTGKSYSSSSNFGKRSMSLPDGYYNHLGELEKD